MKTTLALLGCMVMIGTAHAADPIDDASDQQVRKVVVRSNATFDFDRDDVKAADAQKILADLAAAGTVTWQSVNAVGYTDSVGTETYNRALSERRAAAIKNLLVSKGVTPDMIVTHGKGAQDPVAANDQAEGRALNRRTEVEFQGFRTAANQ